MVRREVPHSIKRTNIDKTQFPEKTADTCSSVDFIIREIFVGSHHNQCNEIEDKDSKIEMLEKVKEILNHLSVQDSELMEKLSLEELTLRLENLDQTSEKVRFGRRLLSIDQCSGEECNTEEELVTDDWEETEEESDNSQYDDLLNEDSLEEILSGLDFGGKLQHINDLLDKFEKIISSASEDEDLYISAIQSLLVYVSAIEDLKVEENPSKENAKTLDALKERLKLLQMKYLSQITHFDTFFNRALEAFEELLEKNPFDRKNKDDVKLLNEFIFNFHYASEIEAIIRRRDIEDELMIISDLEEDMKVMKDAYETLGYGGEEMQNDEYFSRILEDMEDEDMYQSRRLLSISEMSTDQTCNSKDTDCNNFEKRDAPSADNYDRCQHLLERAEKIRDQMRFREDYFLSLNEYTQKLQYIRTFMTELRNSQNVLKEYQDLMIESKICQENLSFKSRMKKIIESIQSQAGNLDWLKHVSSFLFEMKSSEDLLELSEIMKEYDELDMNSIMGAVDTLDTSFKKRSLLSIDTCDKDDLNCKEKDSESELLRNIEKPNNKVKGEDKDKILRRLKHDLDEAYKKAGGNKENVKTSAIVQCQQFLVKSKKDLKALTMLESKADTLDILEPRQKIKLIRVFMSLMTNVKSLFDEYKVLSSSLTENDDKIVCQPVMKEAFDNLLKLQKLSSKADWFNQMNSLLSTEDPEVLKELTDIMQQFKMN